MNILLKTLFRKLMLCIGLVALVASSAFAQHAPPKLSGPIRVNPGGPPSAGAPVPRADVVAPTVPGRLSPNQIAVNRGPNNTPCRPFDIVDPKTGKPIPPDTVLPGGSTARQYWALRSKFEMQLCAQGWSLRRGPGMGASQKIPFQYVRVNYTKLQQQGQALALKLTPPPPTVQTFRPLVPIDPGLLKTVGIGQATNLHTVKSWDVPLGDPSIIAVSSNGKLEVDGTTTSTSLDVEANAGGSLFGQSFNILQVSGKVNAPKAGPLNINVNASVLGFSIYSKSLNQTATISQTDSIDKSFDESTSTQFSLLGIPLTAKVGIHGEIKVPYNVTVVPLKATGTFPTTVNSFGYAHVDVDLGGVQVGIGGKLTIMNLNGDLNGDIAIVADAKNKPTYSYDAKYCPTLDALDGSLFAFVNIGIGDFSTEIDHTFFSFPGIKKSGCLFNESRAVPVFAQPQTLPGKK